MHTKFSKSIVGPLPVQLFFETFANPDNPGILSKMKRVLKKTFSRITSRCKTQEIEAELVHAVSTHGFCPQYDLQSHSISVEGNSTDTRPNLCLYSREESSDPDWTNLELIVDVRDNESADPFPFPASDSSRRSRQIDDEASQQVLEDLEYYISAQFSRQHRTSTLVICIFGRFVRFLHVDHAGVSVSESTNYVSNPRVLAEFLWRYSHLSRIQRGFDPTVVPATPAQCLLLTKAVTHYIRSAATSFGADPKIRNTLAKDYPAYKIEMVDEFSSKRTEYIVRKPFAEPSRPLGRATRGFVALRLDGEDPDETPASLIRRLVFLKDYWRVPSTTFQKEFESYRTLEEHDVPHIPTVISAGDVFTGGQPQRTETQRMLHSKGVKLTNPPTTLSPFVHHRIVQQLGLPLDTLRNAKDLVQVMRDALQALIDGYVKARILHRDISSDNILVSALEDPEGLRRGLLNDWDISCTVPPGCTDVFPRSGTWRFMSCELLYLTHKSHEIYDDLQSLFWVLVFVAARHFKHSGHFNVILFDEDSVCSLQDGTSLAVGGAHKLQYLEDSDTVFKCRALNLIITRLRRFWIIHYLRRSRTPHDESRLEEKTSDLLEIFDSALCGAEEDWMDGEFVADQYPQWDASHVEPVATTTVVERGHQPGPPPSIGSEEECCPDPVLIDSKKPSSDTLVSPSTSWNRKRARDVPCDDVSVAKPPPFSRKRVKCSPPLPVIKPLRRSQRLIAQREKR